MLKESFFEGTVMTLADFSHSDLTACMISQAVCRNTKFVRATFTYADLSYTNLEFADFAGADLAGAKLHRTHEKDTIWRGSNREDASGTDYELAEAEEWQPQY